MIRSVLCVLAVCGGASIALAAGPPALLAALGDLPGGRAGGGIDGGDAAAGIGKPARSDARKATAALAVWGYDPGPVDGDWDRADAAALAAWQADWRLPATGELDGETLSRLTRQHPDTRPRWVETDAGCRVWNRYPQARETAHWTGACVGGATSGAGRLTWRSVLKGEQRVETYDGERRDGREHGRGLYVGADGSQYLGDWRAGLKHGQGLYVTPKGHVYVGGYRDGLRHGRGVYARSEGSRYDGEWRDGVQHGHGVASWPDGSRYEGRLADGKPEGEGTLSFPDGNVYSGTWRAGCFAGPTRGATAGTTPAACGFE